MIAQVSAEKELPACEALHGLLADMHHVLLTDSVMTCAALTMTRAEIVAAMGDERRATIEAIESMVLSLAIRSVSIQNGPLFFSQMSTGSLQVRVDQLSMLMALLAFNVDGLVGGDYLLSYEQVGDRLRSLGFWAVVCRDSLHVPAYGQTVVALLINMLRQGTRLVKQEDLHVLWMAQHGAHEAITRNVLMIFERTITHMTGELQAAAMGWWADECKQVGIKKAG